MYECSIYKPKYVRSSPPLKTWTEIYLFLQGRPTHTDSNFHSRWNLAVSFYSCGRIKADKSICQMTKCKIKTELQFWVMSVAMKLQVSWSNRRLMADNITLPFATYGLKWLDERNLSSLPLPTQCLFCAVPLVAQRYARNRFRDGSRELNFYDPSELSSCPGKSTVIY